MIDDKESFDLGIGDGIPDDADQLRVGLEDRQVVPDYDNMSDWASDGNAILERLKGRESELCALKFYVGDWWNKGKNSFGENDCLQALSENRWAADTVRKISRIAELVPPEVRHELALSFEGHGVVAKKELSSAEQEKLIDKAIEDNLGLHQFRELVNGPKKDPQLSSESVEYGSPAEVLLATKMLFGSGIDLDPASSDLFQQVVKAKTYYTKEDDGLEHLWKGKVFLNPPYGRAEGNKSSAGLWSSELIDAYEQGDVTEAILLVNSATGDKWFRPLMEHYPICFPLRLKFYTEDGEQDQPTRSNAIVYLGENRDGFVNIFSELGPVLFIMQPDGQTGY